MSVDARNRRFAGVMTQYFSRSEKEDPRIDLAIESDLETVFSTTTWGFREIVLLIAVARHIDPSYRASRAFYDCNPRALCEGPMIEQFDAYGIPHRKSGPLNIAKAAVGINDQWAAQRRPASAAEATVRLVNRIEIMSTGELDTFLVVLHKRFLREARRVAALDITIEPHSDPSALWTLCAAMITEVPDGGNTPQRIVGLLLEATHEDEQTGLQVSGHQDRASVTSTTSNKPGDISEEQADGTLVRVYEVTVKPFGDQRIRESYEAISAHATRAGTVIPEVIVLCRPADAHDDADNADDELVIHLGSMTYREVRYHFVDIFEWIGAQLLRMTPDARLAFYQKLHSYVSQSSTAEKVKRFWRDRH